MRPETIASRSETVIANVPRFVDRLHLVSQNRASETFNDRVVLADPVIEQNRKLHPCPRGCDDLAAQLRRFRPASHVLQDRRLFQRALVPIEEAGPLRANQRQRFVEASDALRGMDLSRRRTGFDCGPSDHPACGTSSAPVRHARVPTRSRPEGGRSPASARAARTRDRGRPLRRGTSPSSGTCGRATSSRRLRWGSGSSARDTTGPVAASSSRIEASSARSLRIGSVAAPRPTAAVASRIACSKAPVSYSERSQ